MKRFILLALVVFFVGWNVGSGSPLTGRRALFKNKLDENGVFELKEQFRGGERACVIVLGNNAKDNLAIEVRDADGQAVVQAERKGHLVAAIWYPPRDAAYHIRIISPEKQTTTCYVALK